MAEKRTRPPTIDEMWAEVQEERKRLAKEVARAIMRHFDGEECEVSITIPNEPDLKAKVRRGKPAKRRGGKAGE